MEIKLSATKVLPRLTPIHADSNLKCLVNQQNFIQLSYA